MTKKLPRFRSHAPSDKKEHHPAEAKRIAEEVMPPEDEIIEGQGIDAEWRASSLGRHDNVSETGTHMTESNHRIRPRATEQDALTKQEQRLSKPRPNHIRSKINPIRKILPLSAIFLIC